MLNAQYKIAIMEYELMKMGQIFSKYQLKVNEHVFWLEIGSLVKQYGTTCNTRINKYSNYNYK